MQINKYLHEQQAYIETKLESYLKQYASNSPLYDAICYVVLGGGKRIRPTIVYTIGSSYRIPKQNLDSAACALELIHCYSLVHDDLPAMDDDDFRRGKLSCHKKFGEATAILVGDAIQTLAFEILASPNTNLNASPQLKMIQCLAKAAGCCGIVGGQLRDIEASSSETSQLEIERIHKEKTASLFIAAVELATLAGNREEPEQLGETLGLAFQLQDDILEATATKLDKPLDSDIKNNKATHHKILGLEPSLELLDSYYEKATRIITQNLPKPDTMLEIVNLMAKRTN